MTKSDLDLAISWAAKEGWNPGLYDRDIFYNTDPHGFFMGFLNGKPISCISAVSYGKDFGFIGFYIVHSKHRNKGYGIKIWNTAINYLKTQIQNLVNFHTQGQDYKWNINEIGESLKALLSVGGEINTQLVEIAKAGNKDELTEFVIK